MEGSDRCSKGQTGDYSGSVSLPDDDDTGIREKVFDEMSLAELKAEDGLEKLLTFMTKKLGKDDLTDSLEKFEDFENFSRTPGQSIVEYIAKFDQKYNKLVKLKMVLPPAILAFKLLRKAGISKNERMLVLTGMDYAKKDELYEQAKKSLLKFKGEQGSGTSDQSVSGAASTAIKLEPTFLAQEEEALVSAGLWNPRMTSRYRGGSSRRARGRGKPGTHRGNTFTKGPAWQPREPNRARWKATALQCMWIFSSSDE